MRAAIAMSILAWAAVFVVRAQDAPQKPESTGETSGAVFRSDTRLVVLHTTVADRSGHLVTNLPQTAFNVYENGAIQPIRSFKREDVPVSMGLVVDNSGSMREKRAKVEAAALGLAQASNKEDEVFVVNFNDEAYLDNPHGRDFTSDIKEMEEALTRLDSRGGTAMRDAVRMSIDHLKKAKKDKKVLVVVTDGVDNASTINLQNLIKAAQQSEVILYGIGILGEVDRRDAKRAERALNELAMATGGEAFFPRTINEVETLTQQVARDIRSQYTIQYTPTNQAMDGSFRQIKVGVNAPGRLIARTRSGYYASEPGAQTSKGK